MHPKHHFVSWEWGVEIKQTHSCAELALISNFCLHTKMLGLSIEEVAGTFGNT